MQLTLQLLADPYSDRPGYRDPCSQRALPPVAKDIPRSAATQARLTG